MKSVNWRMLLANARWALITTYRTSRRLTVGLIGTSLVTAVIPAILAVIFGILVGHFKRSMDVTSPDVTGIAVWMGLALLLILVGAVCEILQRYCTQRLNDELMLSVSNQVLTHAAKLDLSFFENPESQDVLFRATQSSGQDFLRFVLDTVNFISMLIQFCSLFGVMFWIEPYFTPFLVLFSLPWMLYQWKMANLKYEIWRSKTTKRRWTRYYADLLQNRFNVSTTKLFNLAPLLLKRFRETLGDVIAADRKVYTKQAVGSFAAATVFSIIFIFLIGWIGYATLTGKNSIENFVAFWASAIRFRVCLSRLVLSLAGSLGNMLFVTNILEFFETRPRIDERAGLAREFIDGAVTLEKVEFCYAGCTEPTLKTISLSIQPGETVAFVGANGAGKTTTAKLIARFYDATRGTVRIDQTDIRDLSTAWLYKHIAYVGQNPVVFEATAQENIAFGDWPRLLDNQEAVKAIAAKVGIDTMITKMPDGYSTRLGRAFGQYDLSGGQWQQFAIARALAKDAAIYILDEPTSNLDMKAEHDIFKRFQKLAAGKTTILISHRFSSVNMADRIFVFDQGAVVESGTHAELLSVGGIYASLYKIHSKGIGARQSVQDKAV